MIVARLTYIEPVQKLLSQPTPFTTNPGLRYYIILGIRDIKAVSILSTLAELGMDSMTGVEVKQTLEREYNIFLAPTEIRSITLARIQEMHEEGCSTDTQSSSDADNLDWTEMLRVMVDNEEQILPLVKLRNLESTKDLKTLPKVFAFPGVEGVCSLLENLTENLEVQAYGCNYIHSTQEHTVDKMVDILLPHIRKILSPNEPFHILSHSVGTIIALETVNRLEKLSYIGSVTFIDGSPALLKPLIDNMAGEERSEAKIEDFLVASVLRLQLSESDTVKAMKEICSCSSLDEKLKVMISKLKLEGRQTEAFFSNGLKATFKRIKACWHYDPSFERLKSRASLFKATLKTGNLEAEDFELGQYFVQPVEVKVIDGSHTNILQNKKLAETIMKNLLIFNGFPEKQ